MPDSKKSKSISLRLFLDGVETRIIGATVNHRPSQPDTASIKIPPHPVIEGIKEKTLVHIFYSDEVDSHKDIDKEYKLLFEGQVSGSQTRLNQSGQNKVIQAQSMAGYLTQTKASQTFLSGAYGKNVNQIDIRKKIQGKEDINISDKSGAGGELKTQVKQAFLNSKNLKEGCHEMMRIIFEHNSFLRDIMRRMKILDRFPNFEKESQLKVDQFLKADSVSKLIQNSAGNTRSQYPVLALINNVLNIFFYQLNLNSTVLNTFNPVPKLVNSPPPACNILTPDDFSNLTFSENHRAKPTRTALTLNNLGIDTTYIWPPELAQPNGMSDRDSTEDIENFGKLFTNEELIKGPRPQVPQARKKVTQGKQKDDAIKDYYMNKAQHNFNVARRNANNLKLSGRFNPEVFPGFTSFVVAPSVDVIFGTLTNVTHSIDNQNNTATTSYQIGMPYKLLTNPDNLAPPETNPALTMSEEGTNPIPIDKLNDIYNTVMNNTFKDNAAGTRGEQGTLTVRQKHVDKYFNGRFDKEKYKKNPVLKRAVVAMGQYLNPNSYIGKSPGNKTLGEIGSDDDNDTLWDLVQGTEYTTDEIIEANDIDDPESLSEGTTIEVPDATFGGEFFRRRTHPNVEIVFGQFYKANKINKSTDVGSGTSNEIWDLYNSEKIDYIQTNLKEEKQRLNTELDELKGNLSIKQDQLEDIDSEQQIGEDPNADKTDRKQKLKSQINSLKNRMEDIESRIKEIDGDLEEFDSDEEKPTLLKTEYTEGYDLQKILQKRQKIILDYDRKLTKSDGGIVGNMDIFTSEILEDDEEDNNGE